MRTAEVDVESLLSRAHAHQQAGRLGPAETLYRKVLATDPTEPRAAQLLAVILAERDDVAGAVTLLQLAKVRAGLPGPDTFGFYNNLANALRQIGDLEEAEATLHTLTQALPGEWQPWHNLGQVYKEQQRLHEAVAALRRACAIAPEHGPNHAVLGEILHKLGRFRSAHASLRRCVELGWDQDPALWSWLGNNHRLLGELDESIVVLQRALELAPLHPDSHSNLAIVYAQSGWFEEAYPYFDRAIEIAPEAPLYWSNRAYGRLTGGQLGGGWNDWEYGLKPGGPRGVERNLNVPRWTPDDPGTTVLAYREQGVGDEILFASCYPDLIAGTADVIVECDRRLVDLFARSFPGAKVRAQTVNFMGQEQLDPPDFDRAIPSGSLPKHFRPTVHDFPDRPSFLVADPIRVEAWRQRLADLGPGPFVGMSWRSRVRTAERRLEYTTLPEWEALFAVPGVTWINLQYDDCERDLSAAERRFGVTVHRWDWLDLMNDFEEIAALTACLDLVVAPRNAVAMLGGALGSPTVMMGNRWDWSDLGTNTSPWFPTIELAVRHTHEEWESVLDTAAARVRNIAEDMKGSS